MTQRDRNIDIWVRSQKLTIKNIIMGIIDHFQENEQFRLTTIFFFLFLVTSPIIYFVLSNHISAKDLGVGSITGLTIILILFSLIGGFVLAIFEGIMLAGLIGLVTGTKNFILKMNEKGVRKSYGSLVKLADEKDNE